MNMTRFRRSSILAFVIVRTLAAVVASGQETTGEYRIGPRDLLEIRVLEIPDLNTERRVAENGTIDLPMLGAFNVGGSTALEARAQLEELLRSRYVNRATVSITIKEFANRPITVVGAVAKPGYLNGMSKWSLLDAISEAGGLSASAGKKIYVLRKTDNGLSDVLEISTDRLFRDADSLWNVPLQPLDVVNIPARANIKIFCIGEAKTQGVVEFDADDRITLLSLIAKAGGLTDRASKTIRIKRRTPDGKDVELRVSYKAILAGKEPDPVLQPNDVVVFEESFF